MIKRIAAMFSFLVEAVYSDKVIELTDSRIILDCIGDNAFAEHVIYANELEMAKACANGLL